MAVDLPMYMETCPECDGWELKIFNLKEEDGSIEFEVQCRDCGTQWKDFSDEAYA